MLVIHSLLFESTYFRGGQSSLSAASKWVFRQILFLRATRKPMDGWTDARKVYPTSLPDAPVLPIGIEISIQSSRPQRGVNFAEGGVAQTGTKKDPDGVVVPRCWCLPKKERWF